MAYTTINKGSSYFNTKLYTGTGTTNSVTGVGFKPDWVWIKERSEARDHVLFDAVRGAGNLLISNSTASEETGVSSMLSSFNTDGFTVAGSSYTNANTQTYVAWNWLGANTTASNTSGTITSTVSANTTSGFSIVSYTGTGTAGATVGHGLGTTPSMIIIKNRIDSSASFWCVYHKSAFVSQADPNILYLNVDSAQADDTNVLGNTTVTINSTVFSLGDYNGSNGSGDAMIAYCFAEVKGYSKFGSYTGNGNADGTFVYTGFKPAMIIRKRRDGVQDWLIQDNKRTGINQTTSYTSILKPNSNTSELGFNEIDILSNGFKCRASDTHGNASGGNYIYMAFADNPFVSSKGIPTTAR